MTHTWPSSQITLQEKHAVVLYKFTKLGEQYTILNTIKHIGVDELIPLWMNEWIYGWMDGYVIRFT